MGLESDRIADTIKSLRESLTKAEQERDSALKRGDIIADEKDAVWKERDVMMQERDLALRDSEANASDAKDWRDKCCKAKDDLEAARVERDSALAREARLSKELALAVDILERGEFPMPPKEGHSHGPDQNCDGDCVDWVRFCDMIQGMKNALSSPSAEEWLAGVKAEEYQRGREQGMMDASCIVGTWHIKKGGYSELAHVIREKARGEGA